MLKITLRACVLPKNILLVLGVFLVATGCAMHGTWYHPKAYEGHAEDKQCGIAGKNDTWVLKRERVIIDISVSPAKQGYRGPAVIISLKVPMDRTVQMRVNSIQVYDKNEGNLIARSFISSGHVGGYTMRLSKDVRYLSGSEYATKDAPNTYYFIALILKGLPPSSLDAVLPRMEINGHKYPPLTIHFTKETGTYFMTSINC